VGEAAILQAPLAWRSAPTERFSESLPRGILPSGFSFVPDRAAMRQGIEFAPLDGHQFPSFGSRQMEAMGCHMASPSRKE
jgi:hypothetical protein